MKKLDKNEFIRRSVKKHGTKYDYSLVSYANSYTKVKIICPEHGIFEQIPSSHTRFGCFFCSQKLNSIKSANKKRTTKDNFINKSNIIHDNKYNYMFVNYINTEIKVEILCKEHGSFFQTPHHHLRGVGCPACKQSKGEKEIKKFLKENNINFETQYSFDNCRYKEKLFFDFYLSKYNLCIEYDGEQHFKKYYFEIDNSMLNIRIERDKIKNDFCKKNNINLLRIKYTDDINEKLNSQFLLI